MTASGEFRAADQAGMSLVAIVLFLSPTSSQAAGYSQRLRDDGRNNLYRADARGGSSPHMRQSARRAMSEPLRKRSLTAGHLPIPQPVAATETKSEGYD